MSLKRFLPTCYALALTLSLRADITLENAEWQIRVIPETLAITIAAANQKPIPLSSGVTAHSVNRLQSGADSASWGWDDDAWRLKVELRGRDLCLTIDAKKPGDLRLLQQPASASGAGLVIPIGEGGYAPAGNAAWQSFLVDRNGEIDTTESLSLPLWGMDHGSHGLHWILLNPFNNTLTFQREGQGVALSLEHRFTPLAAGQPMSLLLHLGDDDLLAGAKRYRQWLMEEHRFEPLEDKLAAVPEGRKLLGASHVYLWGGGLLAPSDVRDWPTFLDVLRRKDAFGDHLRQALDPEARKLLAEAKDRPDRYQQKVLIEGINQGLSTVAREAWMGKEPDLQRLGQCYGALRKDVALRFGNALAADPGGWGGGVSRRTMARLRAAGLPNLWIGFENWEHGLWHPEAIRAAVQAGYLAAPYDSYETALPETIEPDWLTAHLGNQADRQCAVVQADGSLRLGFKRLGHYTNPACIRPWLEQRIRVLQAATGFNSWFLDAYAAGMVFDDYHPERRMPQSGMAEAYNARMRWVGQQMHLPLGSENGNAVTTGGLLFAHGMQTPVFGWGDPEMSKDKQSPYYLGRWYPADQPEVFFKPVPVKEPFRSVFFNPAHRLPLYQAVFHDSVITSHHWSFDNLKLRDVRAENELLQLLYNVAPLYHLSAETLNQRLPIMARQDRFFRPLHQQLATRALTGFRWLTPERDVQQTEFSDGSRLLANFRMKAITLGGRTLPPRSITALLPGQPVQQYVLPADE